MFKFNYINQNNQKLKILTSTIFDNNLVHFFTTRIGGNTPKPLETFTLSAKDYPEYIEYELQNKKIICDYLETKTENLLCPNQQHTDKIAIIKNIDDKKILAEEEFDGIITNLKNIPILLVFADCIPILIFDEKKKVLACVHAGWKGTAKQIAAKAIKIMLEEFNSNTNDIKVAIGAGICNKCFEVNKDVSSQLGMSIKKNYDNIFIEANNKVHVDLKLLNKFQLLELGINKIDVCPYCTSCDNNTFYSYRADNKLTGRHGMLAMIKE